MNVKPIIRRPTEIPTVTYNSIIIQLAQPIITCSKDKQYVLVTDTVTIILVYQKILQKTSVALHAGYLSHKVVQIASHFKIHSSENRKRYNERKLYRNLNLKKR